MFRLRPVTEKKNIKIWKLEGEVHDRQLKEWTAALAGLPSRENVILDLCGLTYISPEASRYLVERVDGNTFIFNSPAAIRNIMHASGLGDQILE